MRVKDVAYALISTYPDVIQAFSCFGPRVLEGGRLCSLASLDFWDNKIDCVRASCDVTFNWLDIRR